MTPPYFTRVLPRQTLVQTARTGRPGSQHSLWFTLSALQRLYDDVTVGELSIEKVPLRLRELVVV